MVDVEHRSLGALEQYALARGHGVVEEPRSIADQRADARGEIEILIANLRVIYFFVDVEGARQELLVLGEALVHFGKRLAVEQVGDADAAARDLVFVTRTN